MLFYPWKHVFTSLKQFFFKHEKVNLEIQCHLKEAETKDITHVDILGRFFLLANYHVTLVCRPLNKYTGGLLSDW